VQDIQRLRATFDEDAERYHRCRPGYPAQLFDDLAAAGVSPGARVLEIGCGTGQATAALAERGYQVLAVELGPAMAALARRQLSHFPAVEVVTGAFEEWPLPTEPFDMVFSATAFHWVDPAVRVAKAAAALRPGGLLATVATEHILGGSEAFFAAAQRCYERWDPATPPNLRLQPAAEIPTDPEEMGPWFAPPRFHRYERDLPYTTAEYLDLLLTYSGHRALPRPQREGLLACLAELIDREHGGRIVKRYLTELRLARRAA
jgi:SAM-dependent methyltransferase